MEMFIANVAFGISTAAIFSQVSVEVFRRGVIGGINTIFAAVAGTILGEILCLVAAAAGVLAAAGGKEFLLLGGIMLTLIALSGLFIEIKTEDRMGGVDQRCSDAFLAGLCVALIDPFNLIFFSDPRSLDTIFNSGSGGRLTAGLNVLGAVTGLVIWWMGFSLFIVYLREKFSAPFLNFILKVLSIVVLGFAVWYFFLVFMF